MQRHARGHDRLLARLEPAAGHGASERLPLHRLGVQRRRHVQRHGPPGERQAPAGGRLGREREHRLRRPELGHQARGRARAGQRQDGGGADPLRHLAGGVRHRLGVGLQGAPVEAVAPGAVREVALRLGRDAVHHRHRGQRVRAHRRLLGQHDRVGAVEDGVGDVGDLGARRAGALDHRAQHLGGGDHRLAGAVGLLDEHLLRAGHALHRDLHAEIAPRDQEGVGGRHDAVDGGQRLGALDLGHERRVGPGLAHHAPRLAHVVGAAHERQRDQVHAQRQAARQVGAVLLRQARRADGAARHVDALVRAQPPAGDDAAGDVGGGGAEHRQLQGAVGQQ